MIKSPIGLWNKEIELLFIGKWLRDQSQLSIGTAGGGYIDVRTLNVGVKSVGLETSLSISHFRWLMFHCELRSKITLPAKALARYCSYPVKH